MAPKKPTEKQAARWFDGERHGLVKGRHYRSAGQFRAWARQQAEARGVRVSLRSFRDGGKVVIHAL